MTYVFLSYGRRDVYPQGVTNPVEQEQHFPLVEKVYRHLNGLRDSLGLDPWFDKYNLTHDRAFTDSINRAIEQSEYLLLFIGKHSMGSEWCEREWKHALRNCVPIIPILLEGKWDDEDVKATYPARILSTDGINPQKADGTLDEKFLLERIVHALQQKPAPLAIPYNARRLPEHYIERPQYLDDLKKRLAVNDRTYKGVTNIVGITSQQEVAALQGIGGIGKTTLALALCHDCETRRNFDHIFWLEVGPGRTVDDVPALMSLIGAHFKDSPELYKDTQTARALVQRHLHNSRSLIVLDDVWAEGVVEQFSLAGVDCRLLVTTRNKALVMNAKAVDKLGEAEGLRLLATLFDAANSAPDKLTDDHRAIVRKLEGYTLAIEIAGKWLKKYQRPAEYLKRLNSDESTLFKNLQLSQTDKNANLELSLSLSYKDLADEDQARFRALGWFAAGSTFPLAALDALWGTQDGFIEAGRLVDAGLLEEVAEDARGTLVRDGLMTADRQKPVPTAPDEAVGTPFLASARRYNQHVLLRAYARALTPPDELDALFPRFADYYTTLAGQFDQLPPEKWGLLDDDLPNIYLTGDELVKRTNAGQRSDLERAQAFAYNITRYLFNRRQVRRVEWLEMGLNATRALPAPLGDPQRYRRRESLFLNELGGVWDALGDKGKALEFYQQALPIRREVGDRGGEGTTLNNIGLVWDALGEKRKALDYYERALPITREVGYRGGEGTTLSNIGKVWNDLGDKQKALQFLEHALLILREVGDRGGEAQTLNNMAFSYFTGDELDKTIDSLKQVIEICKQIGEVAGEATAHANIAHVYKALGQRANAIGELREAIAILRRHNLPYDASGVSVEQYEGILRQWEGE